jgi:hypothetical protein
MRPYIYLDIKCQPSRATEPKRDDATTVLQVNVRLFLRCDWLEMSVKNQEKLKSTIIPRTTISRLSVSRIKSLAPSCTPHSGRSALYFGTYSFSTHSLFWSVVEPLLYQDIVFLVPVSLLGRPLIDDVIKSSSLTTSRYIRALACYEGRKYAT